MLSSRFLPTLSRYSQKAVGRVLTDSIFSKNVSFSLSSLSYFRPQPLNFPLLPQNKMLGVIKLSHSTIKILFNASNVSLDFRDITNNFAIIDSAKKFRATDVSKSLHE
jgi:hypothetical protein